MPAVLSVSVLYTPELHQDGGPELKLAKGLKSSRNNGVIKSEM
ncbi:hypothetical protein [Rhodopirellula bahusiensis]